MARRFSRIHVHVGANAQDGVLACLAVTKRELVVLDEARMDEMLPEVEVLVSAVRVQPREAHAEIDWTRATSLRFLQLLGSGIDGFVPPGLPPGVVVANARGIHLPEMRDHVLALMLAIERELPAAWTAQARRAWQPMPAGSVGGKTVAILGLGEVGRSVAAACSALGMRVLGVRAHPEPTPHVDEVHGPDALEAVLRAADWVVVALPLTDRTRGMLDARAIAWMKPRAAIVNVARGGILDEAALGAALRAGKLRAAALDVFAEEPLPADSPMWSAPNLVVTPHVAGWVPGYLERAAARFVENLALVEEGRPPATLVDPARGY